MKKIIIKKNKLLTYIFLKGMEKIDKTINKILIWQNLVQSFSELSNLHLLCLKISYIIDPQMWFWVFIIHYRIFFDKMLKN